MNDLTITFKKIKNQGNQYLLIFESIAFFNNITTFFELNIHNLLDLLDFINMLQNQYRINYFNIEIDDEEIDMTYGLSMIFNYCLF